MIGVEMSSFLRYLKEVAYSELKSKRTSFPKRVVNGRAILLKSYTKL